MTAIYPNGKTQEVRVIPIPVAMLAVIVTLAALIGGGLIAWGSLQTEVASVKATCERIERNFGEDHKTLNEIVRRVSVLEAEVRKSR